MRQWVFMLMIAPLCAVTLPEMRQKLSLEGTKRWILTDSQSLYQHSIQEFAADPEVWISYCNLKETLFSDLLKQIKTLGDDLNECEEVQLIFSRRGEALFFEMNKTVTGFQPAIVTINRKEPWNPKELLKISHAGYFPVGNEEGRYFLVHRTRIKDFSS